MNIQIERQANSSLPDLISSHDNAKLTDRQLEMISWCGQMSGDVWTGWIEGELVCAWGLIPPSLISQQAYLWMYSTERVNEHKFLFVRHSQRVLEEMLKVYPTIIGHCLLGAESSIRWIKWLGGVFTKPDGVYLPFIIRGRNNG